MPKPPITGWQEMLDLHSQHWTDQNDDLHRLDGPAKVQTHPRSNEGALLMWFFLGLSWRMIIPGRIPEIYEREPNDPREYNDA